MHFILVFPPLVSTSINYIKKTPIIVHGINFFALCKCEFSLGKTAAVSDVGGGGGVSKTGRERDVAAVCVSAASARTP